MFSSLATLLSSPPTFLVHLKCSILTRVHLFFPSSSGSSIISMQWFLPGVMIAHLGISTCPKGLLGPSTWNQSVPMRLPQWLTTHTLCVLTSFLLVWQPTSPPPLVQPCTFTFRKIVSLSQIINSDTLFLSSISYSSAFFTNYLGHQLLSISNLIIPQPRSILGQHCKANALLLRHSSGSPIAILEYQQVSL